MSQTEKELRAQISDLQSEIKKLKNRKKYGLVWEDKPEDVVLQCETNIPLLKEVKSRKLVSDNSLPTNILIEGDNYHSLSVLNYTHRGAVDVIYADPPYNTGATDWRYNNDYVDKNDNFRHSKWISFMEKRLRLAKNLLKENGIICVTIDDYEISRLILLMEEIFGEFNHLGTVPIRNNPAGRSTTKGISITHEYAVFFGKTESAFVSRLDRNQSQIDRYDEKDANGAFEWVNFRKPGSMREESPKMYYPIFATKDSIRLPKLTWDDNLEDYQLLEKPKKGEEIIYPIDDDGKQRRWRWGIERFMNEQDEFQSRIQKSKLQIYVKGRMNEDGILPMTWWDKKEYSSTAYGTNLLKDIFAELQIFSYPKSLYAVMDSLRVMSDKRDAVILDFFAGSGTTGHAVLELNKQDGGNRKFILCTNNENKICEEVTYERLKRVIKGYKNRKGVKVEGLSGNLSYFKTDMVNVDKLHRISDEAKIKITYQAGEMIALRENTSNEVDKNEWWQIFEGNGKLTAIYFTEDKTKLKEIIKILEKKNQPTTLYVFGWGKNEYKNDYSTRTIRVEDIPEPILEVYKEINRI
ncbi:MAG: site-specific DNA-methyltransferase [Candidatus Pacebacteria bacterium]|nr:site-specific DNA-methyltransferase [Candidatus Paceibacterota bacterium]